MPTSSAEVFFRTWTHEYTRSACEAQRDWKHAHEAIEVARRRAWMWSRNALGWSEQQSSRAMIQMAVVATLWLDDEHPFTTRLALALSAAEERARAGEGLAEAIGSA
jgi:hypothetical protein